jgi:DNA-binding IclR family transcriptional regulator
VKERAGIQSVEVGFGLLQVLGEAQGPLMLRDLARAANMSAAKAHRYLVSFQGWLRCPGSTPSSSRASASPC